MSESILCAIRVPVLIVYQLEESIKEQYGQCVLLSEPGNCTVPVLPQLKGRTKLHAFILYFLHICMPGTLLGKLYVSMRRQTYARINRVQNKMG